MPTLLPRRSVIVAVCASAAKIGLDSLGDYLIPSIQIAAYAARNAHQRLRNHRVAAKVVSHVFAKILHANLRILLAGAKDDGMIHPRGRIERVLNERQWGGIKDSINDRRPGMPKTSAH
jgi:hypothetical protein